MKIEDVEQILNATGFLGKKIAREHVCFDKQSEILSVFKKKEFMSYTVLKIRLMYQNLFK